MFVESNLVIVVGFSERTRYLVVKLDQASANMPVSMHCNKATGASDGTNSCMIVVFVGCLQCICMGCRMN